MGQIYSGSAQSKTRALEEELWEAPGWLNNSRVHHKLLQDCGEMTIIKNWKGRGMYISKDKNNGIDKALRTSNQPH